MAASETSDVDILPERLGEDIFQLGDKTIGKHPALIDAEKKR